ncbi:MAG: hypothetical protein CBC13_07365 [Planctomycetia bacterium TMED53]|nr:MAG: hypothetical protein CBC13_07365 [Planctomycetia bacterium TMED53]
MANSRDHVLLLFGGTWSERDVSIKSAEQAQRWLSKAGFHVVLVRWDEQGWVICTDDNLVGGNEARPPWELLEQFSSEGIEVVFNCLHGGPGEDGTVAAWLDMFRLAYTGAGVVGGAVSACKITFRQRVKGLGFRVPHAAVIHAEIWRKSADQVVSQIQAAIDSPWVVKDPQGGSSDGVKVVANVNELQLAISELMENQSLVLVEQLVIGQEISIPCLGNRQGGFPQVLQAVEICLPPGVPFGRQVKDSGKFIDPEERQLCELKLNCPAEVDADLQVEMARAIKQIHMEFDLGTCSRTDLILADSEFYFLETNTCPGMTERSLVPHSAIQSGLDGPELMRRMIDGAISQHLRRWSGGSGVH